MKPEFTSMDIHQLVTAFNQIVDDVAAAGQPTLLRKVTRFVGTNIAIKRCEAAWSALVAARASAAAVEQQAPDTDSYGIDDTNPDDTNPDDTKREERVVAVKKKAVKKAKATSKAKVKAKPAPKAKKANSPAHKNGANGSRGVKKGYIHALLTRKSGCTAKEVLAATGWPAVSMPAMAKACGLKLRKVKEKGSPIQYFGE
jgi:hypothetical protein